MRELAPVWYRAMVRARRFDEISLALQRQGAIDSYASARGQEAIHVGVATALSEHDWLFPSYRQPGCMLARGVGPRELWAHYGGVRFVAWDWRETRCGYHTVPLGSQLAHATGLAWGRQLQGFDDVVVVFFGDGASSQGEVHEAMNFAGVFKAPVVFVCENNGWAISVPWERQSAAEHVADRAVGYGMPGRLVDGQLVAPVHEAVSEAIERARGGGGPSLIEAITYRMEGHTTSDDPRRYRVASELDTWNERDPLALLVSELERDGTLGDVERRTIEEEVESDLSAAVAAWQRDRENA